MEFSVGDVLSRAFSISFRRLLPLGAITLVTYAPVFLIGFVLVGVEATFEILGPTGEPSGPQDDPGAVFMLLGLDFLAQFVVTGALAYAVFQELSKRPIDVLDSISTGLSRMFPVLGVSILSGLGIFLGFLLLVVPGIILACMWYVAVPAVVVERPGVFGAFERSSYLTRGHRWSIFAIFVVIVLLGMGVGVLSIALVEMGELGTILGVALSLFLSLVLAVTGVVAYHDLRATKEGVATEDILAVFD